MLFVSISIKQHQNGDERRLEWLAGSRWQMCCSESFTSCCWRHVSLWRHIQWMCSTPKQTQEGSCVQKRESLTEEEAVCLLNRHTSKNISSSPDCCASTLSICFTCNNPPPPTPFYCHSTSRSLCYCCYNLKGDFSNREQTIVTHCKDCNQARCSPGRPTPGSHFGLYYMRHT